MLAGFPVIQIDGVLRRTMQSCVPLGVLGVVAAIVFHHPLFAPGLVLGLALAVANHRVFQASAVRYTTTEGTIVRKPFAGSVALRLGACTLVAFVALFFVQPFGWGIVGGLVLFQLTLLGNAMVTLLRYQKGQLFDGPLPSAGDPDA